MIMIWYDEYDEEVERSLSILENRAVKEGESCKIIEVWILGIIISA
jgi:hypothetical protein